MNPRLLKPHPLAELMPAMTEDEFVALKDDIKQHGLREPVVVFENMVLDGRHRAQSLRSTGYRPAVAGVRRHGRGSESLCPVG